MTSYNTIKFILESVSTIKRMFAKKNRAKTIEILPNGGRFCGKGNF